MIGKLLGYLAAGEEALDRGNDLGAKPAEVVESMGVELIDRMARDAVAADDMSEGLADVCER